MIIIEIIFLMLLALLVRCLPSYLVNGTTGVDQWFWKAYIEKLRQQAQFPPQLPQFLLDAKQWYPPLFPVLMSKLPPIIFEKYANQLSMLIDLLRMLLLLLAVWWLSDSAIAVFVAGIIYSLTPLLISYNMQYSYPLYSLHQYIIYLILYNNNSQSVNPLVFGMNFSHHFRIITNNSGQLVKYLTL